MLLRRKTLTGQVASILERQILSGKFAAGGRMPSTRDMARGFGVSQQAVKSAIAEMGRRGLVAPRPRDGVYVSPKALAPGRREYAILSSSGGEIVENYVARVLALDDGSIWGGVNFASRSMPLSQAGTPLLRYELERIKEARPDCLIAFTPFKSESEMKPFASCPFPVVFIGDFAWGESKDSLWNQIVEDTAERARASVDAAVRCGARDIALMGGVLSHSYSRTLKSEAIRECARSGARFRYVEFSETHCESLEELAAERRGRIMSLLSKGRPDALILDGFSRVEMFAEALEGSGVLLLNDRELCPGTVFIKSDYRPFSEAARRLIEGLVEKPDDSIGRVVLSGLIPRQPIRIESIKEHITNARQSKLESNL